MSQASHPIVELCRDILSYLLCFSGPSLEDANWNEWDAKMGSIT